jgi:insertion element IS1 protein InsB
MNWVKQVGQQLPDAYNPETIPEVGELDELETFVGNIAVSVLVRDNKMPEILTQQGFRCSHSSEYRYKKNKIWIWTAVDHFREGILGWVIGDHSANTFQRLWNAIAFWQCYFWVTDGNPVYPIFIPDGDQIVSKTYMTRVEGENTRLCH